MIHGVFRSLVYLIFSSVLCCSVAIADSELAEAFRALDVNSRWRLVEEIPVNFSTHHPQGMTVVDERIYLSSVEAIRRAKGIGKGHLFELNFRGQLLRSITLGEGPTYHPGGIDFDGERIWVPVAEYRSDSSTIIYSVDPESMSVRKVFVFPDHLGAIVHDREHQQLIAMSWGARRIYRWKMVQTEAGWEPEHPAKPDQYTNPNHYIDYQDCQLCGEAPLILCSGLKYFRGTRSNPGGWTFGGIDLIALDPFRPVHQIPVTLRTKSDVLVTRNPFFVRTIETGLRFYFIPEDDTSTIYVYESALSQDSRANP